MGVLVDRDRVLRQAVARGLGTCICQFLLDETKLLEGIGASARIECAVSLPMGSVVIRWYPDWQTAVAWLLVTAVASVIYFVPMTRFIDFGN